MSKGVKTNMRNHKANRNSDYIPEKRETGNLMSKGVKTNMRSRKANRNSDYIPENEEQVV